MHSLILNGCAPVPIAHYLKALGILRLVWEQCDAKALGRWNGTAFELISRLDFEGLLRFLLDDYRPTPIVVPWSGSDFFKVSRSVAVANFKKAFMMPQLLKKQWKPFW
jgi:CRISPR-associated protein Csx17